MNQDREHLRLLAIFHYVGAGLAALFSLFPLLYTTIGVIFIFAARHPAAAGPKPGEELPPEFLGWIFAIVGLLLFLLGIAMAICILLAGRCLSRNKHYTFALVMACIECLFIPFGTILGVFTIIALSRDSVKAPRLQFEICTAVASNAFGAVISGPYNALRTAHTTALAMQHQRTPRHLSSAASGCRQSNSTPALTAPPPLNLNVLALAVVADVVLRHCLA